MGCLVPRQTPSTKPQNGRDETKPFPDGRLLPDLPNSDCSTESNRDEASVVEMLPILPRA